jgi:hypothetical protein
VRAAGISIIFFGVRVVATSVRGAYLSYVRRVFGAVVLVALTGVTARASAQGLIPPPLRLELPQRLSLAPTFPNERLRLFPIAPLRFSFSEVRPVGAATWNGPTEQFIAEAVVWWESGRLSLRTVTSSLQSLELDCRLTCAPQRELTIGAEARVDLGGAGAVPENYAYAGYKRFAAPGGSFTKRGSTMISVGLGGALDL